MILWPYFCCRSMCECAAFVCDCCYFLQSSSLYHGVNDVTTIVLRFSFLSYHLPSFLFKCASLQEKVTRLEIALEQVEEAAGVKCEEVMTLAETVTTEAKTSMEATQSKLLRMEASMSLL